MPCNAMFPCSSESGASGVSMCYMLPTIVVVLHSLSVQSAAMAHFAHCGQGLVPVMLKGQYKAALAL